MEERERYFGSVRFFRHVILTTIALLILIPTGCSVCLAMKNRELRTENGWLAEENSELGRQLSARGESSPEPESSDSDETQDWKLLLVNDSHPLEAGFYTELSALSGGQKVDSRIAEPLNEMLEDMRREGLRPVVCSGYRTVERQSELFEEYIEERLDKGWSYEEAFYKAKTRVALPGTSEHQTGLAVDIVGMSHQSLDDAQADTREARWLKENCAAYGFILRYPEGKTEIMGIEYESWHFRYVGEEAAAYIMGNEITLEEYLGNR